MNQPLVIECTFDAPVARVWQALTDRDQMQRWYFKLTEFRPEPGFEFRFIDGPPDHKYEHICRIKEVIPEKKLSYTWHYGGVPGESLLTFELFAEGEKTRLKLTHAGLETFPADTDPNFAVSSFTAGWNHILGTSLKQFVEHA